MSAAPAFVALVLAAVSQAVFLLARRRDPLSRWLLLAAGLLALAALVERSMLIGFAAVTNTFESLLFFSGAVALVLCAFTIRGGLLPMAAFGGTLVAIALMAVASSPIAPRDLLPPIPALRSHWLVLHVTFAFVGEAFFAVAAASSACSLAAADTERRENADRVAQTAIGVGFPVFTAGALVFGAIWAQAAWGSWWSWDPKETWALVTWLTYTAYLHARLVPGLRGRASAILSIAGFVLTLFTFFGVNFLLPGLHSYR